MDAKSRVSSLLKYYVYGGFRLVEHLMPVVKFGSSTFTTDSLYTNDGTQSHVRPLTSNGGSTHWSSKNEYMCIYIVYMYVVVESTK